ncbi:MAG: ABC transporter ATP-binding protein [Synergistota bacterium]|nr:ABC transporter ATP-binding protein [Synergistota bacterium]OPZ41180.1 MAG: putative multidrug export ATP-binding/permease protein [Synergistetes bacterium ADurb.BinA166]
MNGLNGTHKALPYMRLLACARPYARRLAAALACMFVASACNIVPPWLLKNVVDDVLIQKDLAMLNTLPFLLVVLFIGKGLASYGHQYLMNWTGQRVVMDLRLLLYDHLQRMSLKYLYGKRLGELMSRITNDVSILQNLVTSVLVNLVVQAVTFVGMVAFLLYINWRLSLVAFAVIPLTVLILDRASRRLRSVGHEIQSELASLSAVVQEAFGAIRVVRSFATEDLELERFGRSNRDNFRAVMHGVQVQSALAGVIEVVLIAALALILWLGGRKVVGGELTPGELIAFLGYLGFMVQPIRVLTSVTSSLQMGLAAADRIFAMLDTPVDIASPANPVRVGALEGRVAFEGVSFSYVAGREVLGGIDLEVCPGERVAIVGPTGSGKSTLADLVPRFYDPDRGAVLVDGRDVRTLDLSELRRQIGVVHQDSILLRGTIGFNISYGLPGMSSEDIARAADIAGIRAFIESLPLGYDTEVGERGVTLSGGQRQRIAIARAVARNPRILILDEATSSLDSEVERQVQEAMNTAMAGRTSLVIAHRLSTIRGADRIVVLDRGRIVGQGTHDELMAMGGLYHRLYTSGEERS